MVVIVKQTWWHIEEIYYPSYARTFRQVMDIFTDDEQIIITRDDSFVGLKVWARNSSNREIPFIDIDKNNSGDLLLILNPLISFPLITKDIKEHFPTKLPEIEMNPKLHYVKLEIEYISIEPGIKSHYSRKKSNLIFDRIRPKKTSTVSIKGKIQPEISITIPLGWRMSGGKLIHKILPKKTDKCRFCYNIINKILPEESSEEGHLVGMKYFIDNPQMLDSQNDKIELSKEADTVEENEIKFNDPFIKINNGKRTYNYVIDSESYKKIKSIPQDSDITFKLSYISQVSSVLMIVSLVPFILFFPISVFIVGKVIIDICMLLFPTTSILPQAMSAVVHKISDFNLELQYAVMLLILIFSFFGIEYSLIREGFNIPHKYYHYIIFIVLMTSIILVLLMNVYILCKNTTVIV